MLRFTTPIAAAFIAMSTPSSPAFAAPVEATVTPEGGSPVHYSARLTGKHQVLITGTEADSKAAVYLIVDSAGRVDGRYGMSPVSFVISRQQRERLFDQLSENAPAATEKTVASLTR